LTAYQYDQPHVVEKEQDFEQLLQTQTTQMLAQLRVHHPSERDTWLYQFSVRRQY
jgi:hypothetical protein